MMSLPPSIAPRSVPLTAAPPPKRAGRSALGAILAAWTILGLVMLFRNELADEFASNEAWRSVLRKALLALSGTFALASFVPAISGVRRAPFEALASLALGVAWLAAVSWRLFSG